MFDRGALLLGGAALERLGQARIALFGLGGVGSWCAEALVRTGARRLTIVDNDRICVTNVNRQIQALPGLVGRLKAEALRDRLLCINPAAQITARVEAYAAETRDSFNLADFEYVLDAIDSLACKIDLLASAMRAGCRVYAAMGAACKTDPTKIRVGSIWKTSGCPLAREVRRGLRRLDVKGDCLCVYSEEQAPNLGDAGSSGCGTGACHCPADPDGGVSDIWCRRKARINGSLAHMTGSFGFFLAGLVIRDMLEAP